MEMKKKKKRKKKKDEEQNRNFRVRFSRLLGDQEKSCDSGVIFFIYKSFASLHCVYLGTAPIP